MKPRQTRWLAALLLLAYYAVLVQFIVFKAIPTVHVAHMKLKVSGTHTGPPNFVPFKTIHAMLTRRNSYLISVINLLGNILPFMPVGFLAPLVDRRMRWARALLLAFAVGLSMELLEAIFRVGIFDVDDILLNALGVTIGFWVFTWFPRRSLTR